MTAFARYPRPDPEYQKFIDEQFKVAKHRMLSYPESVFRLPSKFSCRCESVFLSGLSSSRNRKCQ